MWPKMPILRAFRSLTEEKMHISSSDVSRLKLLLADIRDAFAQEGEAPAIASADLVKALVAIEGRPWAEMGKDGKPLTPHQLARMLKPLAIASDFCRRARHRTWSRRWSRS